MSLIACCPKGNGCGSTCTDNADCYKEVREGIFMMQISHTTRNAGVKARLQGVLVLLLGLLW